ncbi:MAG TPA: ABC transporter ATP-binding protein [Candidatus Binatia bacterium]|nr:ABC transporter ATP-binding protein [Candidatus Binatia bacterium]
MAYEERQGGGGGASERGGGRSSGGGEGDSSGRGADRSSGSGGSDSSGGGGASESGVGRNERDPSGDVTRADTGRRESGAAARGTADEQQLLGTRDWAMLRSMWRFVAPYKWTFFASLALLPLISACLLAQPWIVKHAIDGYIAVGTTDGLWWWAIAFGVMVIAEFTLLYWQHVLTMLVAQKALSDLRIAVFQKVASMETAFFDRNPVGRLVTRMTTDVDVINEMFAAGAITMIMDVITLVGIVAIMLTIHTKLALAALATLPVMLLLVDFFRRKTRKYYRLIRERIARINAYLQESITGMAVIQLFAREPQVASEFESLNDAHRRANHWSNIYEAALFSIVEMMSAISTAAILWYGAHLVLDVPLTAQSALTGAIGFGTLVAFMEYINKFFIPVRDFSTKYAVLQSAITACEKVFGLLELEPALKTPQRPKPSPPPLGTVEFRDVRFSYLPGEPVLKGVSFKVDRGEHVAIVGATGSGKTTITKLLARFYDVESGSILVDGVDVREWDLAELRRRIVTVLQDVFLFSDTVAANIRMGRTDLDDAAIERAAAAVHVDRFVERLPLRYQAPVRERGNNFSTGQRQLLSFARALAYGPEILVLDEATSSVDHDTEELIQDAVARLQEGRTSIVIAHRLATIENADRILVLHHGELRESGSHAELMAAGGLYARLYRLQHAEAAVAPAA